MQTSVFGLHERERIAYGTFLKKSVTGWIFIDFEIIVEGVLGAMLLIISVSTRCSVRVIETVR